MGISFIIKFKTIINFTLEKMKQTMKLFFLLSVVLLASTATVGEYCNLNSDCDGELICHPANVVCVEKVC